MGIDFSKIFHESSKDPSQGGVVFPGLSREKWPDSWNTVEYKAYKYSKRITLEKNPEKTLKVNKDILELILDRKSGRDYSYKILTLVELSFILKYSCGVLDSGRRANPSAGGRYPIEIYIYVIKDSKDLPSGIYHYNIKEHSLEVVNEKLFSREDIAKSFRYSFVRDSSIVVILTSVFERTKRKYGERGYRYILLEAGHIVQNFYILCGSIGVSCTGLGGTKDIEIERSLSLDGSHESLVYGAVFGK